VLEITRISFALIWLFILSLNVIANRNK
jgi:hypothetical protein